MTSQSYSELSSRPGSLSSGEFEAEEEAVEREKSVWHGCLRERRAMMVFETGVRVEGEERREGPVRFSVAARLRLMSVTVALSSSSPQIAIVDVVTISPSFTISSEGFCCSGRPGFHF